MPSLPAEMKVLVLLMLAENVAKQKLNFSCGVLFQVKTRVSLKYFVSYSPWTPFSDFNSVQTSSNLISLTFLITLRSFTLF